MLRCIDFLFRLSTQFQRKQSLKGCRKNRCSLGNLYKLRFSNELHFSVNLQDEDLRLY